MGSRYNIKLFPYLQNKNLASHLKIDNDSIHYISHRTHADKITDIVIKHLNTLNINIEDAVITDATAGVGGNTIPFAQQCKSVYGIEINKLRADYLKNNLAVYNLDNVTVINDDCINVLKTISDHNVVFIDPPWGGKNYKKFVNMRLELGNTLLTPLETVCESILTGGLSLRTPEIVVLKLPYNYDIQHFYNKLSQFEIHFYDLKKMFILVLINPLSADKSK